MYDSLSLMNGFAATLLSLNTIRQNTQTIRSNTSTITFDQTQSNKIKLLLHPQTTNTITWDLRFHADQSKQQQEQLEQEN